MKLLSLFLLLSSIALAKGAPLGFSAEKFALLKTKNVAEVFCGQKNTYQLETACRELAASADKLQWFAPKIEISEKSTFTIGNATLSLKVSRTDEPTLFEINKKKLNIRDFKTMADLKEAISKRLPKVSRFSLLVPKAEAADKVSDISQLVTTISLLLKATSDEEICKSSADVARLCFAYQNDSYYGNTIIGLIDTVTKRMATVTGMTVKVDNTKGMTPDERKVMNSALVAFNSELVTLLGNLNGLVEKKKMISTCPLARALPDRNAWTEIVQCHDRISKAFNQVQSLPKDVLTAITASNQQLATITGFAGTIPAATAAPAPAGSAVR